MKKVFALAAIISNVAFASALSCVDITRNLAKGSKSNSVLLLQEFLASKGYLKAKPNGYFGVGTVAAVKAYQRSLGLSASGQVFPLTRTAIKKETCGESDDETQGNDDSSENESRRTPTVQPVPVTTKPSAPVTVNATTPLGKKTVSYSDDIAYDTPNGTQENIHVTIVLTDGLIYSVSFNYDSPTNRTSSRFLASFASSINKTGIVGKKLGDVSLSRVGGASLTTNAFMQAIQEISSRV